MTTNILQQCSTPRKDLMNLKIIKKKKNKTYWKEMLNLRESKMRGTKWLSKNLFLSMDMLLGSLHMMRANSMLKKGEEWII